MAEPSPPATLRVAFGAGMLLVALPCLRLLPVLEELKDHRQKGDGDKSIEDKLELVLGNPLAKEVAAGDADTHPEHGTRHREG